MRVVVVGATGNVGTSLVATGCRLFGNPAAPCAAAARSRSSASTRAWRRSARSSTARSRSAWARPKFQKKQDDCSKVVQHP